MSENKSATGTLTASRKQWLKRQANHVVAQLPENEAEALFVLELARRLVIQFLSDHDGSEGMEIVKTSKKC